MKKLRKKQQPHFRTRVLDPRKGPRRQGGAAGRGGGRKSQATLADYKTPIIIGIFAAIVIGGWIVFKPKIHKGMEQKRFERCFNRMKELQAGLEKYSASHSNYGLFELYTALGKNDNESAAAWVSDACSGADGKYWAFIEGLKITEGAKSYEIIGYARTNPLCRITMTPDIMWPLNSSQCGQPPPVKLPY